MDNAIGHHKEEKLKPCIMRAEDLSRIKDRVSDITCHSESANDIVFWNLPIHKCLSQPKAIMYEQLLSFVIRIMWCHLPACTQYSCSVHIFPKHRTALVILLSCYLGVAEKHMVYMSVFYIVHIFKLRFDRSWLASIYCIRLDSILVRKGSISYVQCT